MACAVCTCWTTVQSTPFSAYTYLFLTYYLPVCMNLARFSVCTISTLPIISISPLFLVGNQERKGTYTQTRNPLPFSCKQLICKQLICSVCDFHGASPGEFPKFKRESEWMATIASTVAQALGLFRGFGKVACVESSYITRVNTIKI